MYPAAVSNTPSTFSSSSAGFQKHPIPNVASLWAYSGTCSGDLPQLVVGHLRLVVTGGRGWWNASDWKKKKKNSSSSTCRNRCWQCIILRGAGTGAGGALVFLSICFACRFYVIRPIITVLLVTRDPRFRHLDPSLLSQLKLITRRKLLPYRLARVW